MTDKIHPAIEAVADVICNAFNARGRGPYLFPRDGRLIARDAIRAFLDATREPSGSREPAVFRAIINGGMGTIWRAMHDQLRKELGL